MPIKHLKKIKLAEIWDVSSEVKDTFKKHSDTDHCCKKYLHTETNTFLTKVFQYNTDTFTIIIHNFKATQHYTRLLYCAIKTLNSALVDIGMQ